MNRSVREGKKCKALCAVQRTGYSAIWAIPAETAGNGKDNCIKKKFFKCAINVVKAVQVNISNAYMKLQSMN